MANTASVQIKVDRETINAEANAASMSRREYLDQMLNYALQNSAPVSPEAELGEESTSVTISTDVKAAIKDIAQNLSLPMNNVTTQLYQFAVDQQFEPVAPVKEAVAAE
jgi:hypothetical protein